MRLDTKQVNCISYYYPPCLHSKNVTKWLHEKWTCSPYAINATALLLAAITCHKLFFPEGSKVRFLEKSKTFNFNLKYFKKKKKVQKYASFLSPDTYLCGYFHLKGITGKGHKISKCLLGVFSFFQKTNNNMSHISKNESICSFLRTIPGLTICFRN